MSKYKIEDLKVGAVFKNGNEVRTILMVGKTDVFYSYHGREGHREYSAQFYCFLNGTYGDLVKPTKKIAHVEFWNRRDLSSKNACTKELWDSRTSTTNKFIREFEIEVGVDGFPVEEAL